MTFKPSARLDEKLTGLLAAVWSVLLVAASVQTFCASIKPAPASWVAANPGQAVVVASAG